MYVCMYAFIYLSEPNSEGVEETVVRLMEKEWKREQRKGEIEISRECF